MAVSGYQHFMTAGAMVIFTRDDVGGVAQPTIDLGTITEITPAFELEKSELFDPRYGTNQLVDTAITKRIERYNLTTANMNLENMALLFGSTAPAALTQSATPLEEIEHSAFGGRLLKLVNGSGVRQAPITSVEFVTNIRYDIGAVNTGTKTITITGEDVAADFNQPGDKVAIIGCGALTDGLFTIVSATLNGSDTDIVVEEAITGATASGKIALGYVEDTDWEIADANRGLLRIITGGLMGSFSDQAVYIDFTPTAVTGARRLSPGTDGGSITGEVEIYITDDDNAVIRCRRANATITGDSHTLGVEQHNNMSLTLTITADLEDTVTPMGTLDQIKGSLPAKS